MADGKWTGENPLGEAFAGYMGMLKEMFGKQAEAARPAGVFVEVSGVEMRGYIKDGIARLKASLKPQKKKKTKGAPLYDDYVAKREALRVHNVKLQLRYYEELAAHIGDANVFKLSAYNLQQYVAIGESACDVVPIDPSMLTTAPATLNPLPSTIG